MESPIQDRVLRETIGRLRDKARRKVPDTDAEDLVQEVLVVLIERMQRGKVEALQAYADGILRHKIYDYYQHKRERHLSLENTLEPEHNAPNPEQKVLWMHHLRVIEGLAEENRVDKALVKEHFVEGAPLREVADQLDVSPGVVNGRLFRFRQKLTQRVGSCFAMCLALVVGLWSRATRALMAARAYGSVVGMLSVGSFAGWMWFDQVPAPEVPPSVKVTPSLPTRTTTPTARPTPDPIPLDTLPSLDRHHWAPPATVHPSKQHPTTPAALPVKTTREAAPAPVNTTTAAHLPALPQHKLAPKAKPKTYTIFTNKEQLLRTMFQASKTSSLRTRGAMNSAQTRRGTSGTTKSASHTATPQTTPTGNTNKGNQGNTGSQSSNGGKSGNGGTGQGGSVTKPNPQVKPGHIPQVGQTPGQLPSQGTQGGTFKNMDEFRTDDKGVITKLPNQGAIGGQSFCVVHDGRIYKCGGGMMDDVTGSPINQNPFSCGTHALCKDMIGNGPSLVFAKDGSLFIVGDKWYRKSTDGGNSWQTPSTTLAASQLMSQALFILNQNGSLYKSEQNKWSQLRKNNPAVHEMRVHINNGLVKFEDDTGFKTDASWQSLSERTPELPKQPMDPYKPNQTAPGVLPGLSTHDVTPIEKKTEKTEMIPTSATP